MRFLATLEMGEFFLKLTHRWISQCCYQWKTDKKTDN